jgi:hypothetical protein
VNSRGVERIEAVLEGAPPDGVLQKTKAVSESTVWSHVAEGEGTRGSTNYTTLTNVSRVN